MRKLLIGFAILLALVGGAALYLLSDLDSLVRIAIESAGSRVAVVPVRVAKVTVSLTDGTATVQGLTVANPRGFSDQPAIALGQIAITIDKDSVGKNPLVIKEITVSDPKLAYEVGPSGSNMDAIRSHTGSFGKDPRFAKENPADDEIKLVIDRLMIKGAQLALAAPIGGSVNTSLGDIQLSDIGRSGGGATGTEVASEVLNAISSATTRGAMGAGTANPSVKDAVDQVKGLLGQ